MKDTTVIRIDVEVWRAINKRKKHGDRINDVLRKIFDLPPLPKKPRGKKKIEETT